jgi:hypothetical protein
MNDSSFPLAGGPRAGERETKWLASLLPFLPLPYEEGTLILD